jgi:hypothetical protein
MQRQDFLLGVLHQLLPAPHEVVLVLLHQPDGFHHVHHQQHLGVSLHGVWWFNQGWHRPRYKFCTLIVGV